MFCPQCGKELPDAARFCVACGAALKGRAGGATPGEEPRPAADEQPMAGEQAAAAEADATIVLPPRQATEQLPAPPGELPPVPAGAFPPGVGGLPPTGVAPPLPARKSRRGLAIGTCFSVVALAAIGAVIFFFFQRTRPIESLVPQNCAMLTMVDGRWAWDAAKSLRETSDVRDALDELESKYDLSPEKHIIPWMGKVAFSFDDMDEEKGPGFTCYVEIRNKGAFVRCRKQLEASWAKLASENEVKIKQDTYRGVEIQRLTIEQNYGPDMDMALTSLGGWLIFSMGEGEVEKVIDTGTRHAGSIQKNARWSSALDHVKGEPVMKMGVNGEEFLRVLRDSGEPIEEMGDMVKDIVSVVALYDRGNGLQLDVTGITRPGKLRDLYAKWQQEIGTVSGSSLRQFPADTVVAVLTTKPGKWLQLSEDAALEMTPNSYQRDMIRDGFREIEPVRRYLEPYNGECGAALTWNTRNNLGIVVSGETASAGDAVSAAGEIRALAEKNEMPVVNDNGRYVLDMPMMPPNGVMKSKPCWEAKGQWVRFASHPDWLAAEGKTTLQLPANAKGANFLVAGNFSFLPSLLSELERQDEYGYERETYRTLRDLNLEKAQWSAYTTIEPKGETARFSLQISNWDWRKAIDVLAKKAGGNQF